MTTTRTEAMHVHATGCADTTKGIYRGHSDANRMDVASEQDIIEEIYSDFIEGDEWEDYAEDVRIFPCVKVAYERAEG